MDNDRESITLRGCGFVTQWRFPDDLTRCPVGRCFKRFNSRSSAKEHFISKHADDSVFCFACNKPIAACKRGIYLAHFKRKHPKIQNPFQHFNDNKNKHTIAPYLITLKGCGQFTQWHFPNTKRCPVMRCSLTFNTRLAAMNHYTKKHAPNAIFCPMCNKPVAACTIKVLKMHYQKKHPGKQIPFKWPKQQPISVMSPKKEKVCEFYQYRSDILN